MNRRRHPSPLELGAYFDGELIEGVAEHVARCRKCREELDELHGVRSAVRGELDLTDGSAHRRARWTVALIPVAAAVALLVAVAAPPGGLPVTHVQNADEAAQPPASPPVFNAPDAGEATATTVAPDTRAGHGTALAAAAGRGAAAAVAAAGSPSGSEPVAGAPVAGVSSAAGQGATKPSGSPSPASPSRSAAIAAAPGAGPLRLGVPVPTRGPWASEGDEVVRAVKAVVDQANGNGGVAGRRVELVEVPTDDDAARADALGRVEALVGGFAIDAPAGMPWIMPADTGPDGPDVAARELEAEQAGVALGQDQSARSTDTRTIGAIVAPGPDAGLATGLAKAVAVQQVEAAADTTCDQEMLALRKRDVSALALAVPPDLARRCAAAAARIGWRPSGGLLLAPSAVYAHLERDLVAQGARTAVALSAPSANEAGPTRFRQAAPGCESYRSLVSFAAAELALGAARSANGALTLAAVRDHHWHTDLYDVDGGRQTTSHIVTARFGRWANAPARSNPPSRRGVVNPLNPDVTIQAEAVTES